MSSKSFTVNTKTKKMGKSNKEKKQAWDSTTASEIFDRLDISVIHETKLKPSTLRYAKPTKSSLAAQKQKELNSANLSTIKRVRNPLERT